MRSHGGGARLIQRVTPLFLRLALGVTFLSACGDRFGFWGPPGTDNVAWGTFVRFTEYTARINPWAPADVVPMLAWTATIAELILGLALVVGLYTQESAVAAGVLLLLFALGMTMGTGVQSALNASVFSAAAGAFALALLGPGSWSLDRWRGRYDAR